MKRVREENVKSKVTNGATVSPNGDGGAGGLLLSLSLPPPLISFTFSGSVCHLLWREDQFLTVFIIFAHTSLLFFLFSSTSLAVFAA